ncbi:hypothetical protein [Pedobacter frigiditerrae]|uniref:hypothetical protein n=1 Tax=Pedobacter frigiditerrae TaxID=2530452 RepID=UPI00292E05ED|nr:hypothetical protein [Pedobacter frigiditerrae]
MKTTIKNLKKMMLVALFTLISSSAFAATYYVCAGATLNFTPQTIANISYTWDVEGAGFNAITPVAGVYSITASSTPGTYTVTMRSTSSNPAICAPADVVNDFIVLPPLAFNLASAPSNAQYCTSAGANANSVITPTFTGFPTGTPYTDDLEAEYSYSVVKDGGSAVNGTTVGTINATTGVYTLTTTVIGTYVITGSVKYKQKAGFTNALISTSGCPVTGATTQTVEVIAAPAQPTIVITAN